MRRLLLKLFGTMHSLMTYRQLLTTPLRSSLLSAKPRSTFALRPFHCSAIMSGVSKACCQYDMSSMATNSCQWLLTINQDPPHHPQGLPGQG